MSTETPKLVIEHRELSTVPIHRLIKETTKGRVSDKAAFALRNILEDVGLQIATNAKELADHRNVQTIGLKDIQLAYKHYSKK